MSLRARLRRCRAQLEWLDTYGPLRLCELQLKELELKQQIQARLAAKPRNENARRMGALMGLALPPLPEAPVVAPPRPPPAPAGPPRDEQVRDSSWADTTFATMVRRPPASWPPPLPSVDWEMQDDVRTEEADSS